MTPVRSVSLARAFLVVLIVSFAALISLAPQALAAEPTFPALSGRVVDQAGILEPGNEADITAKLAQLEADTGDQFVVVTVDSLQGYEIEDYGYQLGRQWGIGQAENDGGVLLIVAPHERKVRLEVGYGLEPVLTDALSSHIIQSDILPPFREGGFDRGIDAGVDAVIAQLRLDPAEAQARAAEVVQTEVEAPIFPAVIIVLIFIFFFLSLLARIGRKPGSVRGRRRRGVSPVLVWGAAEVLSEAMRHSSRSSRGGGGLFGGGGFGGGGGFSGGGGSFGGGGASGGW